jgi:hypothetical protein
MLVVAGLLQASAVGLILILPYDAPIFRLLEVGLRGGPVLVLVGGLLATIGWACGPSAGDVKPGLGGSRVVATWAGICIGAGLGFPLGVAPIVLWALLTRLDGGGRGLDQGALLVFFTGSEGIVAGAVVGGVLGSRAGRAPSAVLAGLAAGAGLGFTLGVALISGDVLGIWPQIVPREVSSFLLFAAGPAVAALGGALGAWLGASLNAFRKPSPAPAPALNHGGKGEPDSAWTAPTAAEVQRVVAGRVIAETDSKDPAQPRHS